MPALIFRKGLGLKHAVADDLSHDYHCAIVSRLKATDFTYRAGRLTAHLAHEFGFCYGVDRAVDYAYQTRRRFPDRAVYLTGEIIHNPHVNEKLRASGIRFLDDPGEGVEALGPRDVVILPAFGVAVEVLAQLDRQGCTLVDTTCGSVLSVWKNVKRYAHRGFTSIIHGKVHHEETRATASQALQFRDGRFLVVLNREEAGIVCDYLRRGGDRAQFMARFGAGASPGFEPDRDLQRVGLANQTTMLMSESIDIGELFRTAMLARYGAAALAEHFLAFDTICSATQDRQDAVEALLRDRALDLMVVIGGYNSSNTANLARICASTLQAYHIEDPSGLISAEEVRHKPAGSAGDTVTRGWLPAVGPVSIGLTAGASTPDNIVGAVLARLNELVNGEPLPDSP